MATTRTTSKSTTASPAASATMGTAAPKTTKTASASEQQYGYNYQTPYGSYQASYAPYPYGYPMMPQQAQATQGMPASAIPGSYYQPYQYQAPYAQAYGTWSNYMQNMFNTFNEYMKPYTEQYNEYCNTYYGPIAQQYQQQYSEYQNYLSDFYSKYNYTPYSYADSYKMDDSCHYYSYNLAGYDASSIEVYTENGCLIVSAKPSSYKSYDSYYNYQAQGYYRQYPLPYGCTDKVTASYDSGILYVTVPYAMDGTYAYGSKKSYAVK